MDLSPSTPGSAQRQAARIVNVHEAKTHAGETILLAKAGKLQADGLIACSLPRPNWSDWCCSPALIHDSGLHRLGMNC